MASTINALTTGVGGIQQTGDSSGNISLQSNGSTVLAMTSSGVTVTGTLSNGSNNFIAVAPGTSGNVLTSDGTNWTSSTPPSTAGGGTQTTTGSNITLTSSSTRLQEITPTANIDVVLPNATTLSKGTPIFTISNVGGSAYTLTIKLASGSILTTVAAGAYVILNLSNNSTSDGTWEVNYLPLLATQSSYTQFDSNNTAGGQNWNDAYGTPLYHLNIILSSTSVLTVYMRYSTTNVYGVVGTISGTTITYGSPTLISSVAGFSPQNFCGVGLSSTTALIGVSRSGNTPLAYGLTISGTSITVSTASAGIGSANYYLTAISKIDSTTALISYYSSSGATNYVWNTLTHNGSSAPTLGTVSSATTDAYTQNVPIVQVPLTATTHFVAYVSSPSNSYMGARIITTSGTSAPTLGTTFISSSVLNSQDGGGATIPYSATEVSWFAQNSSSVASVATWTISGTTVSSVALTTSPIANPALMSFGTSTTTLTVNKDTSPLVLSKLTYASGGSVIKTGISVSPNSNYTFRGNLVALSSTQYYGTAYNSASGAGSGVIFTLV